jgi:hypothetical protein
MTSTESSSAPAATVPGGPWTLEVVMLPVSDVDRAKEFYTRVGFTADACDDRVCRCADMNCLGDVNQNLVAY